MYKKIKHWNRQKNHYLRVLKLNLVRLFLDKKPREPFNPHDIKKVLILRDDNKIGDMIVSSGLFKSLHDSGRYVGVVAGKDNGRIIAKSENVDKQYYFVKKTKETIKLALEIRREKYDMVFDFGDYISPIYYMFICLINAKHVLGFNKSKFKRYSVNIEYPFTDIHVTDRYKKALALMALPADNYHYALDVPEDIRNEVSHFLVATQNRRLVVVNPFTASTERDMSELQLKSIVEKVKSRDANAAILIIGPPDRLKDINIQGVDKSPFKTFLHAVVCVENADLVISPDTSWVHVACAFDRNLIALYGESIILGGLINNKVWAPNYPKAVQIIAQGKKISSIPVEQINLEIDRYFDSAL
jgi:ADP-heptose:LPS heptosyltransferase